MNAQELYLKSSQATNIYFCEKCRHVSTSKSIAEECCKPVICECGEEAKEKYWRKCSNCRSEERLKKEQQTYDNAEKISIENCGGPVYCLDNDTYYQDIDCLIEEIEGENDEDLDKNVKVYCCHEISFVKVDWDVLVDPIYTNAYEDFDSDDLKGTKELKAAIKEFENKNKNIISYEPNYKKAVVLK